MTGQSPTAPRMRTSWKWFPAVRNFAFPVVTNLWPVLLFVSQKAFVVPAILLAGFGDDRYRRDLILALIGSFIGLLVYFTQFSSPYDQAHLLGFILFIWSMPLINRATRLDAIALRRVLTWLTLFNVVMGLFLLMSNIDLYGLRGLNRVVGTDGETHRVYFESSSLAAVALATTFRKRWLQIATMLGVFVFTIFIARSVFVVLLLGLNIAFPYIVRSTPATKILSFLMTVTLLYVFFLYLPVLRPDVELSLRAKQFQFDIILGSLDYGWSGLGWGTFIPALASDPDQPYQIEMQLPMLLLQLGIPALIGLLGVVLALFFSADRNKGLALLRFAIYTLIGFNNPWLFVPSWFLTCQLLFRYDDND